MNRLVYIPKKVYNELKRDIKRLITVNSVSLRKWDWYAVSCTEEVREYLDNNNKVYCYDMDEICHRLESGK